MRVMGIDYGDRRIGIAISDATGTLATGVETIRWNGEDAVWAVNRIQTLVREQDVEEMVIGLPRRTDGRPGSSEEKASALARTLAEQTGIPVVTRDERYTTVIATRMMQDAGTRKTKQRDVVDQVAATVILQDYLDEKRR